MFRNCLRNRLIRNLKIYGSTPELRRQHINFFEHAIDHTETKKQLFFFKKVVDKSNENIWCEIRQKLSTTNIFPKTVVKQYVQYMDDLEDGFSQYEYDFYNNNEHTMKNLIGYRLLSMQSSDSFMLQIEQPKSDNKNPEPIFIFVQLERIGIFVENYSAIKTLEWILTATHYNCFNKRFFYDVGKQQQEIHLNLFWDTTDIDETVNFVYRIITEFYEVQDPKLMRDISLSVQLTE